MVRTAVAPMPPRHPAQRHSRRRGRCASSRDSVRGQALALLLPLVAALGAALLLVFDSGQAASEKQRLVDATDAAALSAAAWQARALNFESYMNRAIVANEAAIGQSVSLRSWSSYMNRVLPVASVLTSWIPGLRDATLALQRIWRGFDQALQPSLGAFEGSLSLADHELAAAQRFMHAATLEVVPATVRAVLAANDPRYRLTRGGEALLAQWALEWNSFTSSYGGAWRWRQADLVERSLDGFTMARGHTFAPPLAGQLVRLEKRGGTELLDFETWRGVDTLSIHTRTGLLIGALRERTPLAWGAAENGEFNPRQASHGGSRRTNPRATRLALASRVPSRLYRGLPSLRDLSVAQRERFEPPVLGVRAAADGDALALANSVLRIGRLVDLVGERHDAQALRGGDRFYAQSAATTRFVRIEERADGAEEGPSLFNPYWQGRLTAVSAGAYSLAAALDDAWVAPLGVLP
ncbi:MAG: pilus assembly protein TadG-related protein [Steroidobacteraceae bacterium]